VKAALDERNTATGAIAVIVAPEASGKSRVVALSEDVKTIIRPLASYDQQYECRSVEVGRLVLKEK
jgi:hypothetical protein